jgi:hypothetical protein
LPSTRQRQRQRHTRPTLKYSPYLIRLLPSSLTLTRSTTSLLQACHFETSVPASCLHKPSRTFYQHPLSRADLFDRGASTCTFRPGLERSRRRITQLHVPHTHTTSPPSTWLTPLPPTTRRTRCLRGPKVLHSCKQCVRRKSKPSLTLIPHRHPQELELFPGNLSRCSRVTYKRAPTEQRHLRPTRPCHHQQQPSQWSRPWHVRERDRPAQHRAQRW